MSAALLDRPRIRQSFAAASTTYDQAAALQRQSAHDLFQEARRTGIRGSVLDLGCGTGNLTGLLSQADKVIALDVAAAMLGIARNKFPNAHYVCADAEALPFADRSLDGVYSNLALQWCDPLEKVLAETKRVLRPGGPLLFSTFGPATLRELKNAWAEVDDLPHVNAFHDESSLLQFLRNTGFQDGKIRRALHVPRYASVVELMRELKQIGAHNAHAARPKTLTGKSRMRAMIQAYERARHDGLLPATYEILMVSARA